MDRIKLLDKLKKASEILYKIDKKNYEIEILRDSINSNKKEIEEKISVKRTWALIIVCLITPMGIIGLILILEYLFNTQRFISFFKGFNYGSFVLMSFALLLIIFIDVTSWILWIKSKKECNEKMIIRNNNLLKHIAELEIKLINKEKEVAKIKESEHYNIVLQIPEKYREFGAIEIFYKYIRNGNSGTLEESISLYESEDIKKSGIEI